MTAAVGHQRVILADKQGMTLNTVDKDNMESWLAMVVMWQIRHLTLLHQALNSLHSENFQA